MRKHYMSGWMCCLVFSLLLSSCASIPGSLGPEPPSIRFQKFNSVSISPEGVQFEVQMLLKNKMRIPVPLDRIDYQFDLNNKKLASGSYTKFEAFGGGDEQVIAFPFLLAWEDIVLHAVSKSDNASYRVSFHGTLYIAEGLPFFQIPFSIDEARPIPKLPEITFAGTEGSPFGESFAIMLNLKNGNTFPITVASVDTKLELNNKKYDLVQGGSSMECDAGESQVLTLEMTNTLGKGISMLANVLLSQKSDFKVGGKIIFDTPFGAIRVPLNSKGRVSEGKTKSRSRFSTDD